jgi:hypothetical protein
MPFSDLQIPVHISVSISTDHLIIDLFIFSSLILAGDG